MLLLAIDAQVSEKVMLSPSLVQDVLGPSILKHDSSRNRVILLLPVLGDNVAPMVGAREGDWDVDIGFMVGAAVGCVDGLKVIGIAVAGEAVGTEDGAIEGERDGDREGIIVGDEVGIVDGENDGDEEGTIVGDEVGIVDGVIEGESDGDEEGTIVDGEVEGVHDGF